MRDKQYYEKIKAAFDKQFNLNKKARECEEKQKPFKVVVGNIFTYHLCLA